jgi:hypothetical protein
MNDPMTNAQIAGDAHSLQRDRLPHKLVAHPALRATQRGSGCVRMGFCLDSNYLVIPQQCSLRKRVFIQRVFQIVLGAANSGLHHAFSSHFIRCS